MKNVTTFIKSHISTGDEIIPSRNSQRCPNSKHFLTGVTIIEVPTDAEISLHTLLVKYYNDLLGRQSSERGRDEVTFFYVGDLFCIHLGTKYANFQEKNLREDFWKKCLNFSLL